MLKVLKNLLVFSIESIENGIARVEVYETKTLFNIIHFYVFSIETIEQATTACLNSD